MGNYYGYKKVIVNCKLKLVIDENIREVIELIYKQYLSGLGYKKICDILNAKNYQTPSECIKERQQSKGRIFKNKVKNIWQTYMIKRIIKDDIYIGTFTTHKSTSKFGIMKGIQIKTRKQEQYIFENNHEAIISTEDFKRVEEISTIRKLNPINCRSKHNYIFSGFMRCKDCGFAAIGKNIKKLPKIEIGYNCATYQKYGKSRCTNHSISEEKILFFYKEFLKDVGALYESHINSIDLKVSSIKKTNNGIPKLKRDLNNAKEEFKLLISQKIKDIRKEANNEYRDIIESSYFQIEAEMKKKINELDQRVVGFENISNYENENKSTVDIFNDIINVEMQERKNLELILNKVLIQNDRTVEFNLIVNIDKLAFNSPAAQNIILKT